MKKTILTSLTCLTLGAFLFTGCVKNEESDGVKAVREAQANKINADAEYRRAEAKWQEANADLKKIEVQIAELGVSVATERQKLSLAIVADSIKIVQIKAKVDMFQAYYGTSETFSSKLGKVQADFLYVSGRIKALSDTLYGSAVGTYTGLLSDINTAKEAKLVKEAALTTAQEAVTPDPIAIRKIEMELASLNGQIAKLESQQKIKNDELTKAKTRLASLEKDIDALQALVDYKLGEHNTAA